ncbi:MAG: hypothetical protein GX107_07625 [Clostridiales bacterium]|nr:hypothetical protein [Clostridiales bacterium]
MGSKKPLLRTVFSLVVAAVLLCQTFSLAFTSFAAYNNITGDVIGNKNYTITNPYANVNWDTWTKYKACTHSHTHVSDGNVDIDQMVEKYYSLGYDCLALTDHGTVNYGWTISKGRHTIFGYQFFVHGNPSPLTAARNAEITSGYGRGGRGMIDVILGIEQNGASTQKVHVNSFFVDAGDGEMAMSSTWPSSACARVQNATAPDGGKGVSHINHVGEWSGGSSSASAYDETFINNFKQLFLDYNTCVGMELVNTSDGRTKNDRYLYDQTLMKLAPLGRNIYGFCEDDSHEYSDCGHNANFYIMPSNTWQNVRTSMQTGAFFASSKASRQPEELGDGFRGTGDYPDISKITVDDDKDQIIINCTKANKIKMVADGNVIETYNISTNGAVVTFDLNAYESKINRYVRIYLTGPGGITYVQPFLLSSTAYNRCTLNFVLPSTVTTFVLKDASNAVMTPINSVYYYQLPAGTYYYTATRFGFEDAVNVPVTISASDITNGRKIKIDVVLEEDTSVSYTYFYVPETIYLNPSNMKSFQYYVDRVNENNGALNSNGAKTTGNIYFYRADATNITISADVISGGSLSSINFSPNSASGNTISGAVSSGTMTDALASGSSAVIKWTASFNVGSAVLYAYNYTYVYAPLYGTSSAAAAGGYAETTKNVSGWAHSTMSVTGTVWLAGIHSVSGGSYAYKYAPFGGTAFENASGEGNIRTTGAGMETVSDKSSGGSKSVSVTGGKGKLTVDKSRYTNFKQIPQLCIGLDVNNATQCTGKSADSQTNYLDFGDNTIYSQSIDALNDYSGTRLFTSDNANSSKSINAAINTNVSTVSIVGRVVGAKESRTDSVTGTVKLELTFVDKTALRIAYNNEILMNKQRLLFTNTAAFDTYDLAMKNAAVVLGNPRATQTEINTAASQIGSTSSVITPRTSTATIKHVYASTDVTFLTETKGYELGDMISVQAHDFTGCDYANSFKRFSEVAQTGQGTVSSDEVFADSDNMSWIFYYNAHIYNVTYETVGGTFNPLGASMTATYGLEYTLPSSSPVKTGYTFVNWMLDHNGNHYNPGDTLPCDFTLDICFVAQWNAKNYTVSYNLNGGDPVSLIGHSGNTIEYEGTYALPINIPTRTGHNFVGWKLNNHSTIFSGGMSLTWHYDENGTFYAQWSPISYKITFSGGSGATGSVGSITAVYGASYVLPSYGGFSKTGSIQTGWLINGETYSAGSSVSNLTAIDNDIVPAVAIWNYSTYTVSFNTNVAGLTCNPKTVTYNSAYGTLPSPARTGYNFLGWYYFGTQITSSSIVSAATNHTLSASWSAKSYTLSYTTGVAGLTYQSKTIIFDSSYGTLPSPTRAGYTFVGWYLGDSKITSSTLVSTASNHALTARWSALTYSVSFNSNGGSSAASKNVVFGSAYGALPVPERSGHWFTGWTLDGNPVTSETIVATSSNHTLTASWSPYVYVTVSFDSDGGSPCESVSVLYGSVYGTLPVPTKSGYVFAGWYSGATRVTKTTSVLFNTNHQLKARWASDTYTVTFSTGVSGQTLDPIAVVFAEPYGALPAASRTGYKFNGWKYGGGFITSESIVNVSSDHQLSADWTPNAYTVTFNSDGGSLCDSKAVTFDSAYGTLPSPTKTGYIFSGWYLSEALITSSTTVSRAANHTLKASWSSETYTVTFNAAGGSAASSITVNHGQAYGTLPTTTRTGYSFRGWLYGSSFINSTTIVTATSAHELTAVWNSNQYTISFNSNGGSAVDSITVFFGGTYGEMPVPTLVGSNFAGWYLNSALITESTVVTKAQDHTLTAAWQAAQSYIVSFDSNGGTAVSNITVTNGFPFGSLSTPIKDGYTFSGWYMNDNTTLITSSTIADLSGNIKLYAHWAANANTISFNTNGGTPCSDILVNSDSAYGTLPVTSKTGYEFCGWFYDNDTTIYGDTTIMINAAHTLFAKWSALTYTVSFDSEGGSSHSDITVTFAGSYGALPTPVKAGCAFLGWYYNDNLITPSSTVQKASNHTLTASWTTAQTYEVYFDSNGGEEVGYSKTVASGATLGTLPVPIRTGYDFDSWTYPNISTLVNSSTIFDYGEDITLRARWTKSIYTVTLDSDGGSECAPFTVQYNMTYMLLPETNPTRTGYSFDGWYLNGTQITSSTLCYQTSNHTIKAKWTVNTYTVSFNSASGSEAASKSVTYSEAYGTLPSTSRYGHEFLGWYLNDTLITPESIALTASNHELTARWKSLYFSVSFNTGVTGYSLDPISVLTGAAYGQLPTPTRTGYTFDCWFYNGEYISSDTIVAASSAHTLSALWIAKEYTVSFDTKVSGISCDSIDVIYDSLYGALPSPERNGYSFIGWFLGIDGINSTTIVKTAANHSLSAVWAANSYNVSFQTGVAGLSFNDIEATFNQEYGALPAPARAGYTFDGWYYLGEKVLADDLMLVASDHTLSASWSANLYTISFVTNADGLSCTPVNVTYGSTYANLPNPDRKGYDFAGWYNASNAIVKSTDTVSVASNQTFTAHWSAHSFNVSFSTGVDGLIFDSIGVIFDSPYGVLPSPSRTGYSFGGWYNDGAKVTSESIVSTDGAHTLHAQWSAKQYTVSFNTGVEGLICDPINVTFASQYTGLTTPVRTGYIFDGWYLNSDIVTPSSVVMTAGNHTLTAKWTAAVYTVSFTTGVDGLSCDSIQVTFGLEYGSLPTISRIGYSFDGWKHGTSFVAAGDLVNVPNNHSLTAVWSAKVLTLSFITGDSSVVCENKTVSYDSAYGQLPDPERTGYIFDGWFSGQTRITSETVVTATINHTLTAHWSARQYTVSFKSDGGSSAQDISVTFGQQYGDLPNPVKTGHIFTGWHLDETTIINAFSTVSTASDHELTAGWAPLVYQVSFITGTSSLSFNSITVTYHQAYGALPSPDRAGYIFNGWKYGGDTITSDIQVTAVEPHSLTASWTARQYSVSFNADGGSSASGITCTFDTKYGELPTTTRPGYNFMGWYINNALITKDSIVETAQNHTLKAVWDCASYTVSFNTTVSEITCADKSVTFNSAYGTLPSPERTGHTLDGWFTSGEDKITAETVVTATQNHTLTAKWSINKYSISWVIDGVEAASSEFEFGATITSPPIPEREGFIAYWDSSVLPTKMPASSLTVCAIYDAIACDISLSTSIGGSLLAYVGQNLAAPQAGSLKINYGTTVSIKPICQKGYELNQIYVTHADNTREYLNGFYTFIVSEQTRFTAIFVESDSRNLISVFDGTANGKCALRVDMFSGVTAIADKPEDGKKFSHWVDENGSIVSYSEVYSFVSASDLELHAVYADLEDAIVQVPSIITNSASQNHITVVNGAYSLSYSGSILIPEGYEIVEFGLLLTNQADGVTSENFIIGGSINGVGVQKLVGSTITETGQIKMSVNRVAPDSVRTGRFYLTYTDGDGNTFTLYSESWASLTTPPVAP